MTSLTVTKRGSSHPFSFLFADPDLKRAFKENLIPGLIIPMLSLAVLIAFYTHSATQAFLIDVARLKKEMGFSYSILSTAFFGGMLPYLYLCLDRTRSRTRPNWKHGLFLVLFWGLAGIEVDLFYFVQALIFGNDNRFWVVFPKVLIDQFIYNPFFIAPVTLLSFYWKNANFSRQALLDLNWKKYIRTRIGPMLYSTWLVWIPTVSIVYCLPLPLQVPLFDFALFFWSLYLLAFTRQEK